MKISDVPDFDASDSDRSANNGHSSIAALKKEALEFAPVAKSPQMPLSKRRKYTIAGIASLMLLVLSTAAVQAGFASGVVNVYPVAKMGAKSVTLHCNYSGQEQSITSTYYSNVDHYYQNNSRKSGLMESGDLSKYVYSNSSDNSIKDLAVQIKAIGTSRGLNDDQVLELTTCFVQNIPYDDARGNTVLSSGNTSSREQYPYETLYRNSGICTDKTYLGSALLRELGYGTGIFVFPDAKHVALAVKSPGGYTEFESPYIMMELTTPGFAPGELPEGVDDTNGKPAARINKLAELTSAENPKNLDLSTSGTIAKPNAVIDVNDGKVYSRIVAVKNLENTILAGIDGLSKRVDTLQLSYNELQRRDSAQQSAFSSYNYMPSTKLDCGYKYDYSSSYSYSYTSPYTYTSPYKYKCDTISNPQKNYAYTTYTIALSSYNNQVSYYNRLISDYNTQLAKTKQDIDSYKSYEYN